MILHQTREDGVIGSQVPESYSLLLWYRCRPHGESVSGGLFGSLEDWKY